MDRSRQETTVMGSGIAPMNGSYDQFVEWLSNVIKKIRAGEVGQPSLKPRTLFSWPAAIFGCILMLMMLSLFRVPLPKWIRHRIQKKKNRNSTRPTVDFYARALDQLARLGIKRSASQTPAELVGDLRSNPTIATMTDETEQIRGPLEFLTNQFYLARFGGRPIWLHGLNTELDPAAKIVDAPASRESIDAALNNLTELVDELISKSSRQEPTL